MELSEDEIYRSSTQYRFWSYTLESLASLRSTTNGIASAHVKDAIARHHAKAQSTESGLAGSTVPVIEVDCLTVDEELKLVLFYCSMTLELADFCELPTHVKATAVQFLKRFYLSNSPMTYHPKQIMPSALFLASKAEHYTVNLERFAKKLPKTTAEDVIAPEFLLTQGLRFMFDIRHPHRGMEGGFMEVRALATGAYVAPKDGATKPSNSQEDMLRLEPAPGTSKAQTIRDLNKRVENARANVKQLLKTTALLTDVYFFYTPSQIWLAGLLLTDAPLARYYLDTKLPSESTMKSQVMNVLASCAEMLKPPVELRKTEEKKEAIAIDKKLFQCRNPDKVDLVGINQAQKRDGQNSATGGLDEKVVKKRKMEREKEMKEADDLFGPALGK